MKKVLLAFCVMGIIVFGVLYSQSGKAADVQVTIGASEKFAEEDIEDAADMVKKEFKKFQGMELTDLWYEEEASESMIEGYLAHGNGSSNGVEKEKVIVLLSNLKSDAKGGDGSFEPNAIYSDWNWILIRDERSGKWRVDDWGY